MNTDSQAIGIPLLLLCIFALACPAHAAAPTFQELMNPVVFPDAQWGMTVEKAAVSKTALHVTTTGADLVLDASGQGVFRQRIGHEREVLRIRVQGVASPPTLSHKGPGFAFAAFDSPKFDLRVNGDSLFMLHAHEPVTLEISRAIEPGFVAIYKGNAVVLDEWGGFGLFCSEKDFGDTFHPYEDATTRYVLPADAVLWIGICPPKPYNWERSLKDNVVWHWSNVTGYPPDSDLIAWAKEGNIVLLQSEVMLWKDWNLAFEPRLGAAEFERVRKTIHDQGMRFIVYTSPYYFLKDTPLESKAMNSFDNFSVTGFPAGWPYGVNIDLFMNEIGKVIANYKPDGLYFDGQYTENAPALYALARRARGLLGDSGILEWHSTFALGDGMCFLPQADAYVDFILRGEGRDTAYGKDDYLRYFVSCYNTSNSVGVLCNNGPKPTADLMDRILAVNCRMHTIPGWLTDAPTADVVHNRYAARLTPALREEVDRGCDERQKHIGERGKGRAAELRSLREPPTWKQTLIEEKGDGVAKWTPSISPLNKDPFSLREGALAITGKASTYAFLTHALNAAPSGFVARMKQGTDGGMSWGPAVCIQWPGGTYLRVGLRSDGQLQADITGDQRCFGTQDPQQWMWLRVRWLREHGVVETSSNGTDFQTVWSFEHGGAFNKPAESITVGKIPFNATATDYSEPGADGICLIDEIRVY